MLASINTFSSPTHKFLWGGISPNSLAIEFVSTNSIWGGILSDFFQQLSFFCSHCTKNCLFRRRSLDKVCSCFCTEDRQDCRSFSILTATDCQQSNSFLVPLLYSFPCRRGRRHRRNLLQKCSLDACFHCTVPGKKVWRRWN